MVDSLLGVRVHPAALALHCRTCPTVFLPRGFQVGGCINALFISDAGPFSLQVLSTAGLCISCKGYIDTFQHVIVLSKSYGKAFDIENFAFNRNNKFLPFNNQTKYF